jgi:hypothetical protein
MPVSRFKNINFTLFASLILAGCSQTKQVTVDSLTSDAGVATPAKATKTEAFQALPGFDEIDGDDYYVRLVSEFESKGENTLNRGCDSLAPSFKKNDLSSALIFNVKNARLKFDNEIAGYSYQAIAGNCNYKFEAKKQYLTPWMRLDLGKETQVNYSLYSSANSDVDVSGLVNKVTAASSLLAFTGMGMGVAVLGQVAGQWYNQNQQTQQPAAQSPATSHSSESHSLPALVKYAGKSGALNETVFNIQVAAEGELHIFGPETQKFGELKVAPELTSSLLLKTKSEGLPDARDLSLSEISATPVKSSGSDISLQQLIEQSQHPEKPNLKPDWTNYEDVQVNCRKLKTVLKDLGFNKFDRNAYLYYFLAGNNDWLNYNIAAQQAQSEEINSKTLQKYRSKNFGACLNGDDYAVMKTMGLKVNTEADWAQMGDSSQKKEQFLAPLKAIERQLLPVLKSTNKAEMESQIFPLISTTGKGEGTVLIQNRLGEFGLEKSLQPEITPASPTPNNQPPAPATTTAPPAISGAGMMISARQLAQVIAGLNLNELTCARIIPEQINSPSANTGIVLFTTKAGSSGLKGGAIEFEYAAGKISRIAIQSPTYRDFEQHIADHPESGGCRIEPAWMAKLH